MDRFLSSMLDNGYHVMAILDHREIIPFVQKSLKQKTRSTILYIAINLALMVGLVYKFWSTDMTLDSALTGFGLGIFASMFLIPVHELIHGVVYKLLGAKTVSYKANLRKFVFYAMADKFVVNDKQFRLVAIAPFMVITTSLLLSTIPSSEQGRFVIFGAVLVHTGACSGDFGLMSYFDSMRPKEIFTYDDRQTGKSYFLTKTR